MMTNITKNKITINSIIEFIHKAMNINLNVYCYKIEYDNYTAFEFKVYTSDKSIRFAIDLNGKVIIESHNNGLLQIKLNLSERDIIDLETLIIDIKEYNEEICLNNLNNFFSETLDKPTSVDDLNDDDE